MINDDAVEAKLAHILDLIRRIYEADQGYRMEIGFWDYEQNPPGYYAVLKNSQGQTLLGENSYDSPTIEIALDYLIQDLEQDLADNL